MPKVSDVSRVETEPRIRVTFRLSPRGLARVDALAKQVGVNRSEQIRRMLTAAERDT